MRLQTVGVSGVAAILIGVAQFYFLLYCWVYIAAYTPLIHWLFDLGLRASIRVVLFPVDFLTSVALSLPAGFLLTKLRPAGLRVYLLLAVVPSFLWLNRDVFGSPLLAQSPRWVVLGWLPELLGLPCAVWLVRLMTNRVAPNNSFKPKPLRGSA